MSRLFEEMFQRPLKALMSGAELLNRRISGTQLIDGIISRVVHTLSHPHESSVTTQSKELRNATLSPRERSPRE